MSFAARTCVRRVRRRLSGADDGLLKCWDLRAGRERRRIELVGCLAGGGGGGRSDGKRREEAEDKE